MVTQAQIWSKKKGHTMLPYFKKEISKKFSPFRQSLFAHLLRYPGLAVHQVQLYPGVPCK
jgi:hypothetical protein